MKKLSHPFECEWIRINVAGDESCKHPEHEKVCNGFSKKCPMRIEGRTK